MSTISLPPERNAQLIALIRALLNRGIKVTAFAAKAETTPTSVYGALRGTNQIGRLLEPRIVAALQSYGVEVPASLPSTSVVIEFEEAREKRRHAQTSTAMERVLGVTELAAPPLPHDGPPRTADELVQKWAREAIALVLAQSGGG